MRHTYESVDEFYLAVEELIYVLRDQGADADAARLDGILHSAWTTGSELIGELMLALDEMKSSLPPDLKRLRDDCHYFAKNYRRILGLK